MGLNLRKWQKMGFSGKNGQKVCVFLKWMKWLVFLTPFSGCTGRGALIWDVGQSVMNKYLENIIVFELLNSDGMKRVVSAPSSLCSGADLLTHPINMLPDGGNTWLLMSYMSSTTQTCLPAHRAANCFLVRGLRWSPEASSWVSWMDCGTCSQ